MHRLQTCATKNRELVAQVFNLCAGLENNKKHRLQTCATKS